MSHSQDYIDKLGLVRAAYQRSRKQDPGPWDQDLDTRWRLLANSAKREHKGRVARKTEAMADISRFNQGVTTYRGIGGRPESVKSQGIRNAMRAEDRWFFYDATLNRLRSRYRDPGGLGPDESFQKFGLASDWALLSERAGVLGMKSVARKAAGMAQSGGRTPAQRAASRKNLQKARARKSKKG